MPQLTQAQVADLFGQVFDRLALGHGLVDPTVQRALRDFFVQSTHPYKTNDSSSPDPASDLASDLEALVTTADEAQPWENLSGDAASLALEFVCEICTSGLLSNSIAASGQIRSRGDTHFVDPLLDQAFVRLERELASLSEFWMSQGLPLSPKQALEVLVSTISGERGNSASVLFGITGLFRDWEKYVHANPDWYRPHLEAFGDRFESMEMFSSKYRLEVLTSLQRLLTDPADLHPALDPDGWGDAMLKVLLAHPEKIKLEKLLAKLNKTAGKSPSEKWSTETRALADSFGLEAYKELCIDGLERFLRGSSDAVKFKIGDKNKGILTAFAWSLLWFQDDPRVPGLLSDVGVAGFRKLSGAGVRAEKVAMAAVWALTQLPGIGGVSGLLRVQSKLRGRQLTVMQKVFDSLLERLGLSEADLLEIAAPDFGFQNGLVTLEAGDARVELRLFGREVLTQWFGKDGERRNSVPSEVKKNFPEVVKNTKRLVSEIEGQLKLFTDRFESAYLASNETHDWTVSNWLERYTRHPFLEHLATTLIWQFSFDTEQFGTVQFSTVQLEGRWSDGRLIGADGNPLEVIPVDAGVRLWHPLRSNTAHVVEWRSQLERLEIRQPFKQAHREVYVLTDAERHTQTYSNRFAAHVLRQFQFGKLCQVRGWEFNPFAPDVATLDWPEYGIRAEFWISSSDGEHVASDQLRFVDANDSANGAMNLENIPAVVLSETMRDVDLFVAACSVGNDPNWFDQGPADHRAYWSSYSFGELSENAQSRKQLLEILLPRLKIRDVARLEGKFLHVRGSLREYKIHLGSGNILMLPNDQYLCIVPDSTQARTNSKSDVFLPFEGDRTLAVVLSKAFMLAADSSITDSTILSQIHG